MSPFRPAPLFLVMALLLGPGCASMGQVERPEVSLVNLRVSEMKLLETTAEFTVRILNPGPDPLVLEGGSLKIHLAGVKVGKGVMGERLEVAPFSTATMDVPIYISHIALATRLQKVMKSKEISYRIDAILYREATVGFHRRIQTSHEGVFQFDPESTASPAAGATS